MESLFKDISRVFETADEKTSMDQVEFLGISPFVFYILDFELAVIWHARHGQTSHATWRRLD